MKFFICFLLVLQTIINYAQDAKEVKLKKIRKELKTKKALFPTKNPVYIIDEVVYSKLNTIDSTDIEQIDVVKPKDAIKKFGTNAKNGALVIFVNAAVSINKGSEQSRKGDFAPPNDDLIESKTPNNEIENGVYLKPEYEATIENWGKFLEKNLKYPDTAFLYGIQGDVTLNFVVDTKGKVSDIKLNEKSNQKNNLLVDEFIRIIKLTSGKWKPAKHNGKVVKSRKTQVLSYFIPDEE